MRFALVMNTPALLVMIAGTAHAATFTVASTADVVDATPGDCLCKTANNACTLRAAVMEANACPGADTIFIQPWANPIVLTLAGRLENAAVTGDLDILEDVSILGNNVNLNGGALDRVFQIGDATHNPSVYIDRLFILNGFAQFSSGGAIQHLSTGTLRLQDVTMINHRADRGGGGIYNESGHVVFIRGLIGNNQDRSASEGGGGLWSYNGTVELENVVVATNTSTTRGGGLYVGDESAPTGTGTITIRGGQIVGNGAPYGGGVRVCVGSTFGATGTTFDANTGASNGGGIYSFRGTVTLTATPFIDNTSGRDGGGVYNLGGTASLSNISAHGNHADRFGGFLYSTQGIDVGSVSITNSEIYENSAVLRAGGVSVANLGTISNCNIHHNTAETGGGVFTYGGNGNLTMTNTTVSSNSGLNGGGLAVHYQSQATLTDVSFEGNTATGKGGGVYTYHSTLTMEKSLIANNRADEGAGLFAYWVSNIDLANVTLSTNTAANRGGGIAFESSTLLLNNVTVTHNNVTGTVSGGGGIADAGAPNTVQMSNTIIGDNTSAGYGPDCYATINSSSYSILTDISDCTYTPGTGDISGLSPRLAPLASLGGPTQVHGFLSGSPALDAGDNSTCETEDQRHIPRPQGATCDIGAYEKD